ncbi:MAG: branched-chain amino acid transaminase [Anaerolineales bacterium]|nr:branched-chain amino acid transaminase [Anaerolineales bacterium]
MKSEFIWMDGQMIPYDQATVHFINPTLHYGLGVFEGIRCYKTPKGAGVFRLREHMERFIESIHILGILDIPYTVEQLISAVLDTIRKNGFEECYIRPLMYLDGPLGLDMDKSQVQIGIAAWEWGPYLGEEAVRYGIHMMVSSFTRLHPNINMTKSKVSGNYVNSMLVKTLALRSGYDEAVILDPQGYVAECTGENLFMVRKGVIYTPPLALVLEGITRDAIIILAHELGYDVVEKQITRDQLYIADEIFITGTAAEVVGVRRLDYRDIGNGKLGPITTKIIGAYQDAIHGNNPHFDEWFEYVYM